jgi:hypothetical protein
VYAPAKAPERRAFFENALAAAVESVTRTSTAPVLVGGDWNRVLSPDDQTSGQEASRTGGSTELARVLTAHDLTDAVKQGDRRPTHYSHSAGSAARLDRIYVSTEISLDRWVGGVHTDPGPADHHAVLIELAPPDAAPGGNGAWKMPTDILGDDEYCTLINDHAMRPNTWRARSTSLSRSSHPSWSISSASA